jgi:hypothetical protein
MFLEKPNGIENNITSTIPYFIYRRYLSARKALIFFGNGILCNKSCAIPMGHSLPQKSRPNTNSQSAAAIANIIFSIVSLMVSLYKYEKRSQNQHF